MLARGSRFASGGTDRDWRGIEGGRPSWRGAEGGSSGDRPQGGIRRTGTPGDDRLLHHPAISLPCRECLSQLIRMKSFDCLEDRRKIGAYSFEWVSTARRQWDNCPFAKTHAGLRTSMGSTEPDACLDGRRGNPPGNRVARLVDETLRLAGFPVLVSHHVGGRVSPAMGGGASWHHVRHSRRAV